MPSTPEIVDATVTTGLEGWIQDALYPWVSPAQLMAFIMIALGLFAFHSIAGSAPRRWLENFPIAFLGFALGNLIGYQTNSKFLVVGDIHIVQAYACMTTFLAASNWLNRVAPQSTRRFFGRI